MCSNCSIAIDTGKSEAFAERLLGTLNEAAIALMLSMGHRTGLFDVMAGRAPSTISELATEAGLNERYVREWLGAMVAGRIVDLDPETDRYSLPPEHASFLTREAGGDNLAQTMQWFGVLGSVEDKVTAAFSHGKGVPYSAYERFHEVMADESALTVVAALTEHILPLEPGLIEKLDQGIDVLDVGCGFGRANNHLAKLYPQSRFVGYDISEEAIATARREADVAGVTNSRFEVRDAATFDDTEAFDLVFTFDAVHDQAKPDALLANLHRALRPGGTYLCQDIQGSSSHHGDKDHPIAPFIYTISCMHCMSVSLAMNGAGLGAAWGRKTALRMFSEAGFNDTRVDELEHDFINYYYISHKEA